ncbi:uncharacterized protein LOC117948942 [Etheostoma cragini]|uniref:uncharacterized protein LOC117948942 n=1 Tax=Etheostoma cragini TaxID=417921 RepID=UPI00155EAF25|nr:uncharacterized protein LOC117948942 [Etheostoma cragini]
MLNIQQGGLLSRCQFTSHSHSFAVVKSTFKKDLKMNIQSFCSYGLKSTLECISRATLLSQPTDIPSFFLQYLSELIGFRESYPETDPKIVSFSYQKMWENKFLKTTVSPITTTKKSPEVPSETELKEALKTLYLDLASSGEQKKFNPLGKDKNPSATPMFLKPAPPPCSERKFAKDVVPPVLVVKGDEKPAPLSANINMKTRRVSTVRVLRRPPSEATIDDIVKTPATLQLKTIHKKTPTAKVLTSSTISDPSKLPNIPIPKVRLVIPPIPRKKTIGSLSLENREVVPERRALGPLKRAPNLEAGRVPNTERDKKRPTTPKVQQLNNEWNMSNRSPERKRILWTDREKVKALADRKVQGAAFNRQAPVVVSTNNFNLEFTHTCPHLGPNTILGYKRMLMRSLFFGRNGPH